MADPLGVWLHAVTRDLPPAGVAGLAGVGGRPVRTVEAAGLVAVVCSVDLDEFGAEPMRRNLEDLAWLESVARAHHAVVDAASRLRGAVPAQLGTVYRDDSRVQAVLSERRGDFTAVLDRVSGRDEWGVKAFAVDVSPSPSPSPVPSPAPVTVAATGTASKPVAGPAPGGTVTGSGTGTGPGAAYLRRRRTELDAAHRHRQAALDGAEEVHAALAGHAEQARRHPPQDRRLSGRPDPMVLNGAYLVGTADAEPFTAAFAALVNRFPALHLQLTGPWPPYSFVAADEEPPP
ncbi:GvpL/GvpF family gas vesicle protein [Dactylosporangium sp. NBC_01737]|uniref:GvpL/GvpF family gas vesicle protein n=1 Tax=Dactylosporangium sp. NBC_01737 TaxID=2975959 RepID=UPI002E143C2A|nr:GvpL/GvpF family gas vesicle protein [Dactylosporangium sp. NBC_01737]